MKWFIIPIMDNIKTAPCAEFLLTPFEEGVLIKQVIMEQAG